MGWYNTVSIATHYRLNVPGIESQWGRDFPHLSRPALGPTQQRPGCGVDHPPPSSAEVKGRVELYLYFFVACSRVNFTFYLYVKSGNSLIYYRIL